MNLKQISISALNSKQTYLPPISQLLWICAICISILSCSSEIEKNELLFISKSAAETGVDFQNNLTSTPQLNILNYIYFYNGAGVAAGDFNKDGLPDIYFTANQTADKLYLNKGAFQFTDITSKAGITNDHGWTTGVTTVDINHDGWLDIYISKVNNGSNLRGSNMLYVNQGINKEGLPTFVNEAHLYELDFSGYATQANFFDYDLDGDLDVFLLNHSVNPNQNYGKGSIRNRIDLTSGDKLFENNHGIFTDVSTEAGILQSKIGYGLGASISDTNNDGYPDIYVGNDFFENDYFYINNGDKTFTELITTKSGKIGHTTHFSMGNDIADINNDGFTDILSVDMLPENLQTYKTSGTEFNYQIYTNYLNNGYTRQYMQNTLQLNNQNGSFSETAYLSGIAATEWSWAPLIADFDNDGLQDAYISNGILGATNDMDFINFIANDHIQKSLGAGMQEKDMAFIHQIPKKKTNNYIFQNQGENIFKNRSETWTKLEPSYSNGAIYVDLDGDGDLDIVTNNVNSPASVLENTSSRSGKNHWIQLKLKGDTLNPQGIGTKIRIFSNGGTQLRENFATRGYLSAVNSQLHFGLGTDSIIDSLHVVWPDKTFEVIRNVTSDTLLSVAVSNGKGDYTAYATNVEQIFTQVAPLFNYTHKENTSIEFNRNPLLAFAASNEGPSISVADVNMDSLEDVFVSGGKQQASQLWIQQVDGGFIKQQDDLFSKTALNEDVSHDFFDANGDRYPDLVVASGGNEFKKGTPTYPRIYINNQGVFTENPSAEVLNQSINASKVKILDIDADSDEDFVITSNTFNSSKKGHESLLFLNDNNEGYTSSTNLALSDLTKNGGTNDILLTDINSDGTKEIIAAGDWTEIQFFNLVNTSNKLKEKSVDGFEFTNGFWNVLKAADFDNDGDIDIIAGNWGLNSRLQAAKDSPITLYTADFDNNGSEETILTHFYQGVETPLASKDELVKQLPFINKKYLSFNDFSKASVADIFGKLKLENAKKQYAYELASCYFENTQNGTFIKHRLPFAAQVSTVNDIWIEDFNKDGYKDLLLVGNNFEISTQLSSLDASHGVLLMNDRNGGFVKAKGQKFDIAGAARQIEKLSYQGNEYLIITRNNDQPIFLRINN